MAKPSNINMAPGGGGGRTSGGITGNGGRNINPVYNTPTSNVKVIKAGSKPLTQKTAEASRANEAKRIADAAKRLEKIRQGSGYNWSE
jgi:hypothetical protein